MNPFFPPNVTSSGTPHTLQSEFSIRDHFAGLAMQAVIQRSDPVCEAHFNNIAEDAYRAADAMLKQRSLTND